VFWLIFTFYLFLVASLRASTHLEGRQKLGLKFVMVTDWWNWLRTISSGKLYYYNCIEALDLVPVSWITTNTDFTKICCGDRRLVDLAHDYIRWQILVLAVLNLRFLLPECAVVIWSTCSEGRSRWKTGQCTDQLRR